ncbi:MAG: hypothetical protein P1U86_09350 [Verrucomicrobiales bacterium]|nr:hypothetical protein [Verrucomicrobiales bacterium]
MKSPILNIVKKTRKDLSGYLWYFCREDRQPEQTILKILADKKILAGEDWDTKKHVTCFTEAPLEEMRKQAIPLRGAGYKRLSLYGVGFSKKFIFANGGLPVIYQPRSDLDALPPELKWRHVDLDLSNDQGNDYSWQREWRINGNLDFQSACREAIVIVPEAGNYEGELYNIEEDGEYVDGEMVSSASMKVFWNFVSLDWLPQPLDDSAIEVVMMKENLHLYPPTQKPD